MEITIKMKTIVRKPLMIKIGTRSDSWNIQQVIPSSAIPFEKRILNMLSNTCSGFSSQIRKYLNKLKEESFYMANLFLLWYQHRNVLLKFRFFHFLFFNHSLILLIKIWHLWNFWKYFYFSVFFIKLGVY